MFTLPGTAALMLRTHTWMSDVAIANTIRRRTEDGEHFWIKSTKPGNHHYHVIPTRGGFVFITGRMRNAFAPEGAH